MILQCINPEQRLTQQVKKRKLWSNIQNVQWKTSQKCCYWDDIRQEKKRQTKDTVDMKHQRLVWWEYNWLYPLSTKSHRMEKPCHIGINACSTLIKEVIKNVSRAIDALLSLALTHSMLLASFYTHWKH